METEKSQLYTEISCPTCSKTRMVKTQRLGLIKKKNIGCRSCGKKSVIVSEATKKIQSELKKGYVPWNRGKKGVQVAWNKGMKGFMSGEKHYNWGKKGHCAGEKHYNWIKDRNEIVEKHRIRASIEWKKWRASVFARDMFTCRECGKHGGFLEPHHITPIRSDKSRLFDINNGITLCRPCHQKTIWKESEFQDKYQKLVLDKVAQM